MVLLFGESNPIFVYFKKDNKTHLAQKEKNKQANMHDEVINYREKVGSKRAKNIVNRVSVNKSSCIADVLKSY